MINELEKHKLLNPEVTPLSGTSGGSIIAVAYASDLNLQEVLEGSIEVAKYVNRHGIWGKVRKNNIV